MIRILFVCLGNICRSPLAEGIFNKRVEEQALSHVLHSVSVGTSDYHIGEPADRRSIQIARQNDIVINHKGRQLSIDDFSNYDYIIAMDRSNYRHICAPENDATGKNHKIFLMREFDDKRKENNVPDPYWSGAEGFQEVFDILDRSIRNFLIYLKEKHKL
jgi:protein-tyrosine phosphatase